MRRPPAVPVLLPAALLTVLLAAGCGGGDDPATDGPATASPTSSPTTSPATSPTTSTGTPTPESTYAGTAPADGPALVSAITSLHAPQGWNEPRPANGTIGSITGFDGNPRYSIVVVDEESSVPDASLDALAEVRTTGSIYDPPLERQDDVVLQGQPAYHLAGPDRVFQGLADEYGLYRQGHLVTITITVPEKLAQAEREAIDAAVMASLTFTG